MGRKQGSAHQGPGNPGQSPTPKRTQQRLCRLQGQAELKVRARELRAQEDQLAAEREVLEREWQKVQLEKERVSAVALRLRLRTKEVESTSQVPG